MKISVQDGKRTWDYCRYFAPASVIYREISGMPLQSRPDSHSRTSVRYQLPLRCSCKFFSGKRQPAITNIFADSVSAKNTEHTLKVVAWWKTLRCDHIVINCLCQMIFDIVDSFCNPMTQSIVSLLVCLYFIKRRMVFPDNLCWVWSYQLWSQKCIQV